MKVAILHPWFLMQGGGERVVDILAGVYPEADVYSLFVNPDKLSPTLRTRGVRGSLLNRFPFSSKIHRQLLPLYPWAVESLDLREYDVVISSCGPAMMGCNVHQDAVHICYCHTPQRSWWDLYAEHQLQLSRPLRDFFTISAGYVRTWEFAAMQRVDHVIANSKFIADRIYKYFRRDSTVIYPPVNVDVGPPPRSRGNYYLTVGRLEKQKRVDVLIEACNQLGRKLVIVGTGKEENYLKSLAGPTIEFRGFVADETLPEIYRSARAFLFAALEDFGIAPVEAQAHGLPVIAYGRGGVLEVVRVNDRQKRPDTGVLSPFQTVESFVDAIQRFEKMECRFDPEEIRLHSTQFDVDTFIGSITNFVDKAREKRAL